MYFAKQQTFDVSKLRLEFEHTMSISLSLLGRSLILKHIPKCRLWGAKIAGQ